MGRLWWNASLPSLAGLLAGASVLVGCGSPPAGEPVISREPVAAAPSSAAPAGDAETTAVARDVPPLVVVSTDRSGHSRAYRLQAGEDWPTEPFATVLHRAEATPRAVLHSSGAVLLAASVGRERDRSFDYALFRLDRNGDTRELVGSLVHAGAPHLGPAAKNVLVVRGEAGSDAAPGGRIDRFTLDAVDPATGTARTWHEFVGHHLHLAAVAADEVYLYRMHAEATASNLSRADLVAVDAAGRVRVIRDEVLPFARDFSLDEAGRLVYRQRHPERSRRWQVLRLDPRAGTPAVPEVLFEGDTFALAPHAWPGGGVVFNPRRRGLQSLDRSSPFEGPPTAPLGPGVDLVVGSHPDGFVALLHTEQSALPQPYVVDVESGAVVPFVPPAGERVAIAGFEGGVR
ncbi:MAG: hypothetical protein AAGN82_22565 [Myxococcota bacterium]